MRANVIGWRSILASRAAGLERQRGLAVHDPPRAPASMPRSWSSSRPESCAVRSAIRSDAGCWP